MENQRKQLSTKKHAFCEAPFFFTGRSIPVLLASTSDSEKRKRQFFNDICLDPYLPSWFFKIALAHGPFIDYPLMKTSFFCGCSIFFQITRWYIKSEKNTIHLHIPVYPYLQKINDTNHLPSGNWTLLRKDPPFSMGKLTINHRVQ